MRRLLTIVGFWMAMALTPSLSAAGDDPWIHVTVDGEDERVRVNVPLALLEAILPLIEEDEFRHGRIRIDDVEFRHEDVVNALEALRDAEDGEYITVEERGESVRISKEGKMLLVRVEDEHGPETVDIKVPVAVLDALVAGDGDELDLLAAIRALGEHGEGDLITVSEHGSEVRIWIDDKNESE